MREGRIFHTFNALRGVAALGVVCFHLRRGWFPGAYLAVDLFFVLSGFVLAFAHDDQFAGGLTWGRFLAQRVIRLWPLYALGVAIAVVSAAVAGDRSLWSTAPLQILFLPAQPGPGHAPLYPLDVPAWSLMFELGVNAAWAIFWRWLRGVGLAIAIAAAGFGLLAMIIHQGSGDVGSFWSTVGAGVPRAVFGFLLGVGLFRLRLTRTPKVTMIGWGGLCGALGCILMLPLAGTLRTGFDAGFDLVLSPAVILAASIVEPPRPAIPFSEWLGAISYPIYAVHWPLIQAFEALVYGNTIPLLIQHAVFLGLVVCFGAFLAAHYDPWARRSVMALAKSVVRHDRAPQGSRNIH